jgi:hypothetical protein
MQADQNRLEKFGFAFPKGSPHLARTMMSDELGLLLNSVSDLKATRSDYFQAIIDHNCLGKKTMANRLLSRRYLVQLYTLDPDHLLFRSLRFFWMKDTGGQPLLSLLCSSARDPLLQLSAPFLLEHPEGAPLSRESLAGYLEQMKFDHFSNATLKSATQNICATWTKSGHVRGKRHKIRSRAHPTPGSVSYALLLGYLCGFRGHSLFTNEYAKLLDCSFDEAAQLAEGASRKGWVVFKRVGDVVEVNFPNLITTQEMEWLHEQN